jgi:PAS domain S-box-containing protein
VIELNDAFTQTYGWSMEDGPFVPPYPWRAEDPAAPADRDRALRRLDVLREGGAAVEEQFPIRRRDGSAAWVNMTVSLVPADADHPALVVGVARDWTRERESRMRRSLAARLAVELSKADDLEQVISAAVTGFSVLFDGSATVRVTAGRQDLVLSPTGTATLGQLDPSTRAALESLAPLEITPPGAPVATAPGGAAGDAAGLPRPGLLLVPTSHDSQCRAWVQFDSPRVVPSDELIVGDLLAQTFSQAVDRVIAQRDRSEQETHFQRAVESHRLIGNAVGVLIERHRVTAAQGFEMLRQASLNRNIKLREIALRVVETGMEPSDTA